MPTRTITVCARCEMKTCDGGVWRIVKVVGVSSGQDFTGKVHPDNLEGCTLKHLGRQKKYRDLPVGHRVVIRRMNWVTPSDVVYEKVAL